MNPEASLYTIGESDIEKASGVLAEAFSKDPFFSYLLDDRNIDRDTIRPFHAFTLRAGIRFPGGADRRSFLRRVKEYGDYSGMLHKRRAPFPHWYLLGIGVADRYRGQGFAGKLIRPMLARLDAERMPCYLETHNPVNLTLYGHYGFRVVEEGRLPGTDKPHWAMLRIGENPPVA